MMHGGEVLTMKYNHIKNLKIHEVPYLKIEEIEVCCSQFEEIVEKAFFRKLHDRKTTSSLPGTKFYYYYDHYYNYKQ